MPGYTKAVAATAPAYQGEGQELAVAWNRVTLLAAELTLNAVYPLVRLPRGAIVHDVVFTTTDMDTGATLIFSVGVAGDTERYVRRVSGQAAGTFRLGNDATAAGTHVAAAALAGETTVDLLVQTAAGTGANGTVQIAVVYSCE